MAGLYFEEFFVGQVFKHAIRRTVSEMDNIMFSALTHNPAALHLDEEYCKHHTEYGQRIVNSVFTLGLIVGVSVGDTTLGTTVANLGCRALRLDKPMRANTRLTVATLRPTVQAMRRIGIRLRRSCSMRSNSTVSIVLRVLIGRELRSIRPVRPCS